MRGSFAGADAITQVSIANGQCVARELRYAATK